MKRFQVFIRCRELPSAHAEYTYSVDASRFNVAAARGLALFQVEKHVWRKRFACVELRVTMLGPGRHNEEKPPLNYELDQAGG